jgi:hypothetical protein
MPEVCESMIVFLEKARLEELVGRGIICGERRLLTGASAQPLIGLMLEKGVEKLVHGEQWSFDARDLNFTNLFSGYHKATPISVVSSRGEIFRGANRYINPFYDKTAGGKNGAAHGNSTANYNGGHACNAGSYRSGKERTENLSGAGEMNDMINALPLNRKERYWTSCVFPNIVCGEKFSRLAKLLNLIGVPAKFIKSEYSNSEILFYTEYSLKESALGWDEIRPLRRDTPDIVILLKADDGDKFLVVIEAKMFDFVVAGDIKNQIARQKPVINAIAAHNKMSVGSHVHAALVYSKTPEIINAIAGPCEKVISWKDIVDFYEELAGNYFYEILKVAAANPQLITTKEAYLRRR